MMENKYDDQAFFEKYNLMARSQKGLAGAGEWHELKKLLPDFRDNGYTSANRLPDYRRGRARAARRYDGYSGNEG